MTNEAIDSKELDEAAEEYATKFGKGAMGGAEYTKQDFIAGAEWQRKKTLKDAVKCHCVTSFNPINESPETNYHCICLVYDLNKGGDYIEGGNDVNLIILKDNEAK